jgi:hypothetical protein
MSTYSINVGTITESLKKEDIYSALVDLPDNVQKKISPKDLRDAIFTSWASSAFKLTKPDSISTEYIGIDSSNPEDRDIKKKILLGKRSVGNLDVLNDSLLNVSDADIFFYNTKNESDSQNQTKLSILAGTDSNLFYSAPFIAASFSPVDNTINMEIRNPSLAGGAINLYSDTGRVGINGVAFPTVAETNATASTGKILKYYGTYPNGFLKWSSPEVTTSVVGSTGTPTYIYGSSSYVNGYPLEFIVSGQIVPENIGGITQGSSFDYFSYYSPITATFQNWPIVEVLRNLLYPYIEPELSISALNTTIGSTFAEIGTTPSVSIDFSIKTFARDSSEYISEYFVLNSSTWSIPSGYSFSATTIDYILSVSNQWPYVSPIFYATASIQFIYPFLSILGEYETPSQVQDIFQSGTTSRYIYPYTGTSQSIKMNTQGIGYLYFVYHNSYPEISMIKDINGFILHDSSSLTYSAFTWSSSVSGPFATTYKVYRTIATCSYVGSGQFEFIF